MAARVSLSRPLDRYRLRAGMRDMSRGLALEKQFTVTILVGTKHC